MRTIKLVPFARKEEIRKYFYEYLIELYQLDYDIEFDKAENPIYKWFDCYWEDKERYPFLLNVDGEIAGLALIRELEEGKHEIAEFYVCPKFRKDGNAIWFASQVTNLFEGEFSLSAKFTNPRAIHFWNKFTKSFKYNSYIDDENWRTWTICEK